MTNLANRPNLARHRIGVNRISWAWAQKRSWYQTSSGDMRMPAWKIFLDDRDRMQLDPLVFAVGWSIDHVSPWHGRDIPVLRTGSTTGRFCALPVVHGRWRLPGTSITTHVLGVRAQQRKALAGCPTNPRPALIVSHGKLERSIVTSGITGGDDFGTHVAHGMRAYPGLGSLRLDDM